MQKKFEIDPLTGLRLEVLDPLPSQTAALESNLAAQGTGDIPPPERPAVIEPFNAEQASVTQAVSQAPKADMPFKGSLLDKLIHIVAGNSDADLRMAGNTAEVKQRQERRRDASESAKRAAENPGDEYMEIPLPGDGEGSRDTAQQMGNAVRLIGKLFGAR